MEYSSLQLQIAQKVQELITDPSYFLVEIVIKSDDDKKKVIVLIDGDQGVDIDECARISRQLGNYLEEEELINVPYRLELSSFGLDHPLKLKRQYHKNIGRKVRVKLKDAAGEPIEGKLEKCDEEGIEVLVDAKKKNAEKEQISISFDNILTTNILIQF